MLISTHAMHMVNTQAPVLSHNLITKCDPCIACVCVCVCVFWIIRSEGGQASCQLSVDTRNIIKNIMLLLCMICSTPCTVPHLINVHMHDIVLMDPTKLTRNCQAPPPPPPPPFFGRIEVL